MCEGQLVKLDAIAGWEFRPGSGRGVETRWAHGSVAVDPGIAIPPVPGAESPAYEEARAAFAENKVIQLSADETDRVGAQAAEALAAAI